MKLEIEQKAQRGIEVSQHGNLKKNPLLAREASLTVMRGGQGRAVGPMALHGF